MGGLALKIKCHQNVFYGIVETKLLTSTMQFFCPDTIATSNNVAQGTEMYCPVALLDMMVTSTPEELLHNKAFDLLLSHCSDITVIESPQSVIMTAIATV